MCSFICEVHFLKIGIYPRNFFWYDSLSKISLPLFPAPLIKLWGQNFNFRSFLWGTYRNSLFQFPLCSTRGFNNVRKVSFQSKSMPIKIQSHPLFVYLFLCRKIFLPMYLTHECSEVSKRDLRSPRWEWGESLFRNTTERVAEALKDSLEQDEPFPARRARETKRVSIYTREPKSRMTRADTVISYHTHPQMYLSISQHVFLHRSGQNKPTWRKIWGVLFGLFFFVCEISTGQFLDFGFNLAMKKKCAMKIML